MACGKWASPIFRKLGRAAVGRLGTSNFAARLFERIGERSDLIDAATGEAIGGAQVPARIAAFAAGFRDAGIEPGQRLILGCNLSPLSTLAYLGAIYAGLTVVPVNERTLPSAGKALLGRVSARAIWSERTGALDWARHEDCLRLSGASEEFVGQLPPPAAVRDDDLAALMPTSGSTGAPRLVMVSHANLIANTEAIVRSQSLAHDERAMLILPISYCFGASIVHTHLYQGGSVVYDSRFMFPDKVLQAVATHGCTTFAGVPTVYSILLHRSHLGSIPMPGLRRFLQAGGHLPMQQIREVRTRAPEVPFFVMYGQTEATSRISCLSPAELDRKAGSVGLPLDNLEVRIVDEEGQEAAAGRPGELQVRGPSVCRGYFAEPRESARRWRDGWLSTGDVASRDPEGYLWIVGRKGEFLKMRGVRIGFAEIEARVCAIAGVAECAAAAAEHDEAGESIELFIVAAYGGGDLADAVRRQLPRDWICGPIHVVAQLPRNAHGKLERARLRGLVPEAAAGGSDRPGAAA